jgi:hypothetical protein
MTNTLLAWVQSLRTPCSRKVEEAGDFLLCVSAGIPLWAAWGLLSGILALWICQALLTYFGNQVDVLWVWVNNFPLLLSEMRKKSFSYSLSLHHFYQQVVWGFLQTNNQSILQGTPTIRNRKKQSVFLLSGVPLSTKCVWVSPSCQVVLQQRPAGHPLIQLNSDTIYSRR